MVQPHTSPRIFRREIRAGLVATERHERSFGSFARGRCWKPAKEETMRAFFIACCAAIVLAIGPATMLGMFVQQSSSQAFSTTAVRLD